MGSNISSVVDYSSTDHNIDSLHPTFANFCIVLQCLLVILGGCGNILTLTAIALHKKLHQSYNIYIAHLACVDLLISFGMVPVNIAGFLGITFADLTCEIVASLSLCCLVVSILTLMLIAVNRYVLICKDRLTYGRLFSKRTVLASICAMWVWAFTVTLPLKALDGLGWSEKTHYCFFKNYQFQVYLYINICFASLGVIMPSFIAASCYIAIIRKLRIAGRKLQPNQRMPAMLPPENVGATNGLTYDTIIDGSDLEETQTQIERSCRRDSEYPDASYGQKLIERRQKQLVEKRKMLNCRILGLVIIFSIFMICWMPLAVTFMIDYRQQLPAWVYVFLMSFAYINSTVNVYLYAHTNRTYHHAFISILKLQFSRINSK